jgi:cell wall-associated NlpC family hydrolase
VTPSARAAAAAQAAVGTRFRWHGRDPATGLDCVGLALVALHAGGFIGTVAEGYALRGGDAARIAAMIDGHGLVRVTGDPAAGDLLLCGTGPGQFHFAIRSAAGVIHADAMLRRVVARPDPLPWPVIASWRLPEEN